MGIKGEMVEEKVALSKNGTTSTLQELLVQDRVAQKVYTESTGPFMLRCIFGEITPVWHREIRKC